MRKICWRQLFLLDKGHFITEIECGWHKKCIKRFFGTKAFPVLNLNKEQLDCLALQTVSKGMTVPGVQRKISLHLSTEENARLTIVDYPMGYILKPQSEEYKYLPEYEDLAMRMAFVAGIKTVPHALIKLGDQYAYITKRIDRDIMPSKMQLFAMEDFCQLSGRLTRDKYRGSYEQCAQIIKKYSIHPGLDLSELFLRVIFSLLIGNSDMHLKNFSLREAQPAGREYCLSDAYDILPTSLIISGDTEELALTLNGKKKNIGKRDILFFADKCEIAGGSVKKMINKMCACREKWDGLCDASYLSESKKHEMKIFIQQRCERLQSML